VSGKTALGYLTPKLLAERIERDFPDAQVKLDGARYKVVPGKSGKQIVYFTAVRFGNGPQVGNILRDLRKAGIDLERPEPKPAPAQPAAKPAAPPQENTMSGPGPGPLATRAEVEDTREMVRTLESDLLGLLGQAEGRLTKQESELNALREEVAELRRRGPARPPVVSAADRMRAIVLAYFEAHRGEYLTPQVVDFNLVKSGKLPANRMKTAVATACKQLSKAGTIKGGGSNGNASDPMRGIYYMEPADKPKDDKQR
jgi:hypothetical protein